MQKAIAILEEINSYLGGSPWFVYLLLGTGIFFTLYLGFPQLRYFGHALKIVRGKFDKKGDKGDTTHFQALTTALSGDLMNNYVTFTAGLFRSIRFGASSAHGIANLMRYNYFAETEAFTRSEEGIYTINPEKMQKAIDSFTNIILTIQGDGDYNAAVALIEKYGAVSNNLKHDLENINKQNIPVDIIFKQGPKEVGLAECKPKECDKATKKCCDKKK